MFGFAESEHPVLISHEIIIGEFQTMSSRYLNVTDRRADRQTTCRSNTALCVASRCKNHKHKCEQGIPYGSQNQGDVRASGTEVQLTETAGVGKHFTTKILTDNEIN